MGSTRLSSCEAFKDADVEERAAFVEEVKGCALCLSWKGDHKADNCPATVRGQPFVPCKEIGCGKKHHRFLHGASNAYVNHNNRKVPNNSVSNKPSQPSRPESAVLTVGTEGVESYYQPPTESELEVQDREGMNTMFLVQKIPVQARPWNVTIQRQALAFYDKGSNVTMIRNKLAEELGLEGPGGKTEAGQVWRRHDGLGHQGLLCPPHYQ